MSADLILGAPATPPADLSMPAILTIHPVGITTLPSAYVTAQPSSGPSRCIVTRAGNCGSNEAQVRDVSLGYIVRNHAGEGAGAPGGGRHVDGCIVVHDPGTAGRMRLMFGKSDWVAS